MSLNCLNRSPHQTHHSLARHHVLPLLHYTAASVPGAAAAKLARLFHADDAQVYRRLEDAHQPPLKEELQQLGGLHSLQHRRLFQEEESKETGNTENSRSTANTCSTNEEVKVEIEIEPSGGGLARILPNEHH